MSEHDHKKHKVRAQHWNEGRLITNEFLFDSIEEALDFCGGIEPEQTVKIYNNDGELTHHICGPEHPESTYA